MIKRVKKLLSKLFRSQSYYDELFYSPENQKRLKELVQELEDGKGEYRDLLNE